MDPLDPRDLAIALAEAELRGNVAVFQQKADERIQELERRVEELENLTARLDRMCARLDAASGA